MSKKILKFDSVEVNKKEFHVSKQPVALNLVNVNQILISDKLSVKLSEILISEYSDKGFKYFIGYKDDNIIRPLYIILPQMRGYIKYFDSSGKNVFYEERR